MPFSKSLVIIGHAPSPNTQRMVRGILDGANNYTNLSVQTHFIPALDAVSSDVLNADGVILFTPENLGYMSGALKEFFDRHYYSCLNKTDGLASAIIIRAGSDGTGTKRALKSILTGLRWKLVQEPLICRGSFEPAFISQCEALGASMSAGLEMGIM